jgi:putative ABC transport system permease protein
MLEILTTACELGLLYALAVYGVYLSFRILDFPDLSVDGTFVTGGAAAAVAIKSGLPGLLALIIGFFAGCLGGAITGLLHTKLGISKILSGILTLGMLYTINLRLMDAPNLSLLNQANLIPYLKSPVNHLSTILFLLLLVLSIKFILDWFLATEFGLFLRATGENEATVRSFGMNHNTTKLAGLILANGLVGTSGALVVQYQGFVDVNMGIGLIISGLAALLLGEAVMIPRTIQKATLAVLIGIILYNLIFTIALRIGLPPTDLKFMAALIVILTYSVSKSKRLNI